MLKNLGLLTLGFIGGLIATLTVQAMDVEKDGNVEYEDDRIKVTAGGNKSRNWAFGKIEYKQDKPETEEE